MSKNNEHTTCIYIIKCIHIDNNTNMHDDIHIYIYTNKKNINNTITINTT